MKNLYYATFTQGLDSIVEKFIKKQDKKAHIKRLYNDGVVFFTDEHFPFTNTLFNDVYFVYDFSKREGYGAANMELKHLMERKDLKIFFPKEVRKFSIHYFIEEKGSVGINQNLRTAFETMLAKKTKKQIGFFNTDAEIIFFVLKSGDCIFGKKETRKNSEFAKITSRNEISPQKAFALNFLSNPVEKEVSLDPFSELGMISYVRAFSFKKANVIANCENTASIPEIKAKARRLKEKSFSVMNYDFLSNKFPIRFIDKIVTVLPQSKIKQSAFFEKVYMLKVKTIVLLASRYNEMVGFAREYYNITDTYVLKDEKIYKLELKKD